jgi:hypothetical protein
MCLLRGEDSETKDRKQITVGASGHIAARMVGMSTHYSPLQGILLGFLSGLCTVPVAASALSTAYHEWALVGVVGSIEPALGSSAGCRRRDGAIHPA